MLGLSGADAANQRPRGHAVTPSRSGLLDEPVQIRLHGISDPDFALRTDRHVMGFAEFAKRFAGLTRRGDRLAVRIELQNLAREAADQVHLLVRSDVEAARQPGELPFLDVLALAVEDLHAPVLP